MTPALVRADLEIRRGEMVLVRGPNGAGKSTLLRIVATAISPTYGRGEVLGFDLLRERTEIRRRTELLGHRTRLYDALTARENLRFWAVLLGMPATGVEAALNRVGLAPVADERVGGFSHGMRQRLALGRTLLRSPDLLLLDEPYAGLDREARRLVGAVVGEASAGGGTVVVATHEPAPDLPIDRTVVMEEGRVTISGGVP
jgi:heme exporter protein A